MVFPRTVYAIQHNEDCSESVTTEQNISQNIYVEEKEKQSEDVNDFLGYNSIPLESEMQLQISEICIRYEIPFELMLGIAEQESAFDINAYNDKSGDYGLFQINAKTWDETANKIGLSDYRTNVIQNAEMACYIFDYCLKRANRNVREALNYYRTGTPNNKYEAGSDYATIVLENYSKIKESE